jgi:hypothetical protein
LHFQPRVNSSIILYILIKIIMRPVDWCDIETFEKIKEHKMYLRSLFKKASELIHKEK